MEPLKITWFARCGRESISHKKIQPGDLEEFFDEINLRKKTCSYCSLDNSISFCVKTIDNNSHVLIKKIEFNERLERLKQVR